MFSYLDFFFFPVNSLWCLARGLESKERFIYVMRVSSVPSKSCVLGQSGERNSHGPELNAGQTVEMKTQV